MKKILLLIIPLFIIGIAQQVNACSCIYIESFCKTISGEDAEINPNLTIIRGKISIKESDGIRVQVQDYLGGKVPVSTEIFIRSGNGADCGVFTGHFSEGQEFVFAMWGGSDPVNPEYVLSECGVTYLQIDNEIVKGAITNEINSIEYHRLGTVTNCTKLNLPQTIGFFSIYPTLTTIGPEIVFDSRATNADIISWSLFSLSGKLIDENKSQQFQPGERIPVNMEKHPAGVYLLRLKRSDEYKIFKVLKI